MKNLKIIFSLVLLTSLHGLSQPFGDDDFDNNEEVHTPAQTPRRGRGPEDNPQSCEGPNKRGRTRPQRPFARHYAPTARMNERMGEDVELPPQPNEMPEYVPIHADDFEDERREPRRLTTEIEAVVGVPELTAEEREEAYQGDLETIRARLVTELLGNLAQRRPNGCGEASGEMGWRYY